MNWVRKRASVKGENKGKGERRVKVMVVGLAGVEILVEVVEAVTLVEVEVVTLAEVVAISNVRGDGITHFGSLVAPVTFRDPVLLARQAAALDDLSGGRLILDVGAGWEA